MATLETYVVRSIGLHCIRRLRLTLSYYQELMPNVLDLTYFLQLFWTYIIYPSYKRTYCAAEDDYSLRTDL